MATPDALAVVQTAVSLRRTHRHAPPLDVLDLAMRGGAGPVLDFGDTAAANASLVSPAMPFGQLIAEAFDKAMTPLEWTAFTGATADSSLRVGCLQIWRVLVMPRFEARYGVMVRGLP
jgi:hypothetical protein